MSIGGHLHFAPAARRIVTPELTFAVQTIAQPFTPVSLAPSAAPVPVNWMPPALAAVWACGFFAIGAMRLRQWRRVRTALRASEPLAIPAEVEIRAAPGLMEPGVVGWLRPALLLPADIVERLTPRNSKPFWRTNSATCGGAIISCGRHPHDSGSRVLVPSLGVVDRRQAG